MSLANRRTDRFACLEQYSSSIDKVSFKKNSMSLGLVVLEKKLFTWTRTQTRTYTPQSDDIKIENSSKIIKYRSLALKKRLN